MSDFDFNFDDVVAAGSFEPLPEAWYSATVTGAKYTTNDVKQSETLEIKFTIYGEHYAGMSVTAFYLVKHSSATAVRISNSFIKSLLIETGCDDSQLKVLSKEKVLELILNKQVGIKVTIEEYNGAKNNRVKQYKNIGNVELPKDESLSMPMPF